MPKSESTKKTPASAKTSSATKTATKTVTKTATKKVRTSSAKQVEKELVSDLKDLTKEVKKLKNLEFIEVLNRPWKFMWFSFLKGLMVGFGTVVGASVLVWLLVKLLGQISWVPVIGDFVQDVLEQIKMANA